MRKSLLRGPGLLLFATTLMLGCGPESQRPATEPGAAGALVSSGGTSAGFGIIGGDTHAGVGGIAGAGGASGAGGRADATAIEPCTITTPTHWTAGVYVANCNLDVASALTIDPGAILKFGRGFSLTVRRGGTLTAIGSESQPIVFTSLADDAHGGDTNADGASVGSANDWGCQGACGALNLQGDGCALEYVQALYASSGVYIQSAATRIQKSSFAHHESSGLVVDGHFSVDNTQLNENAFFDNHGYPVRLEKPVFLDSSNVFHNPANPEQKNGKQCIEVDTDLNQLVVLGVTEVGFLISGRRISAEVLTPAGVIFKARDAAIYLDAAGSFANGPNVIFTSYKDDALGGDCLGDGASTPAVGDWEGLMIDDGMKADYAAPVDYVRFAAKSGAGVLH